MKTMSIYKSPEGQRLINECYSKSIKTWPVPYETMTIKNEIADAFVIACGSKTAPPMVLFHGSGSNSMTWAGESLELSKHFRLYAVDLPGEPGNSQAIRYDWQGQEYMDWISVVLDSLDIDSAYMGGLSLGGGFALKYAAKNPERIKALVLISPGGVVPVKVNWRLIWYALQGEKGFDKMCRYLFPGVVLEGLVVEFMQLAAKHFNYGQGQPPQLSDQDLENLSMPVFYYAGKKDQLVNTAGTVKRLNQHVPDLHAQVFEDKGHLVLPLAERIIADLTVK